MFTLVVPWGRHRLVRLFGRTPVFSPRSIRLRRGEVLRLDADLDAPTTCRVVRGTVWLTATPAAGDIILSDGEALVVSCGWPVVAEAIGDEAEMEVTTAIDTGAVYRDSRRYDIACRRARASRSARPTSAAIDDR